LYLFRETEKGFWQLMQFTDFKVGIDTNIRIFTEDVKSDRGYKAYCKNKRTHSEFFCYNSQRWNFIGV